MSKNSGPEGSIKVRVKGPIDCIKLAWDLGCPICINPDPEEEGVLVIGTNGDPDVRKKIADCGIQVIEDK